MSNINGVQQQGDSNEARQPSSSAGAVVALVEDCLWSSQRPLLPLLYQHLVKTFNPISSSLSLLYVYSSPH